MDCPRSTPDQTTRLGAPPGDDGASAEASTHAPVLVVGLGEVGRPLLRVLSAAHTAFGRDVADRAFHGVQILHVCFPFGPEFIATAARYGRALPARGGRGQQHRCSRDDEGHPGADGHTRCVQPGARQARADGRGTSALP